jgi:hypothetical protein
MSQNAAHQTLCHVCGDWDDGMATVIDGITTCQGDCFEVACIALEGVRLNPNCGEDFHERAKKLLAHRRQLAGKSEQGNH